MAAVGYVVVGVGIAIVNIDVDSSGIRPGSARGSGTAIASGCAVASEHTRAAVERSAACSIRSFSWTISRNSITSRRSIRAISAWGSARVLIATLDNRSGKGYPGDIVQARSKPGRRSLARLLRRAAGIESDDVPVRAINTILNQRE
jgi:hypothetical protein